MSNRTSSVISSPAVVAVSAILAIAVASGVALLFLHRVYHNSVRSEATREVLLRGESIVEQLARHAFISRVARSEGDRDSFSHLVSTLGRIEPAVQYVSVTEEGDIDFHTQLRGTEGVPGDPAPEDEAPSSDVRIRPRLLHIGGADIPIMTFTLPVATPDGMTRSVQVAVRKDAVALAADAPSRAMGLMFRVSLVTVCVAFALCAILAVVLARREMRRQESRRQEEHLAFAGAMADGIIHDIRNPLSSMRLDVQLLRKEASKGEDADRGRVAELAEHVRHTVDRVDGVLSEFLNIAAPSGTDLETLDLNRCVTDCLDLLARRFESKNIALRRELCDEVLPVAMRTVQVKRAITNILVNASQSAPEGGTVIVRTRHEGDAAVIDIIDDGPGIPKRDRSRVFDMFFSTRPGGTGLGLALARTAVTTHGGDIAVRDTSGQGAHFEVTLPCPDAGEDATEDADRE